jgi:hypothetical protein
VILMAELATPLVMPKTLGSLHPSVPAAGPSVGLRLLTFKAAET